MAWRLPDTRGFEDRSHVVGYPQDWQDGVRESDGVRYEWRIAKKGEVLRCQKVSSTPYFVLLDAGEMLHRYSSDNVCRMESAEVA